MVEQTLVRLHAVVSGRVQGVNFRYFVTEQAHFLGVQGWVRNRLNGKVEVVAEAPRAQLELLLRDLHQGPSSAHVTRVESEWQEATGEFSSFWVRSTV